MRVTPSLPQRVSDVINRLVSNKNRDIREYAGALRDSEVLDRLQTSTREMRDSMWAAQGIVPGTSYLIDFF